MLDFPGVRMTLSEDACILQSDHVLHTISSAIVGGGFLDTRVIVNRHVHKNYDGDQPTRDLQHFVDTLQLDESFVGLMTGVPINGTRSVILQHEEITVASVITAGVGNAITSGVSAPVALRPGTINMIVLVDAHLVPAAMVNAVITATEAKTAILQACGVRASEGELATGTSTDAVVIACTGRGVPLPYAGPATPVGYLIGRSVHECLIQALKPCGIFYSVPAEEQRGMER
jgi:adenosylcobinamide hydrolase